jgi:hypothetical protein
MIIFMSKSDTNGHHQHPPQSDDMTQIEKLAAAIDNLTDKVESFMNFAGDAIPTKVVYLIFGLVFGLFFGIESVKFIFEHWLPKVMHG